MLILRCSLTAVFQPEGKLTEYSIFKTLAPAEQGKYGFWLSRLNEKTRKKNVASAFLFTNPRWCTKRNHQQQNFASEHPSKHTCADHYLSDG